MINQNVNTCNLKLVCSILDTTGVTLTQIGFEINLVVAAEGSRLSPECLQATNAVNTFNCGLAGVTPTSLK